jgi:toxin-antitoxin system PIN domain toxin
VLRLTDEQVAAALNTDEAGLMPALADVNFLLALCYEGHVHHPQALSWLGQQDDLAVVLCRNTQLGLLRLLSNAAVMGADVCTQERAWEVYDALAGDPHFDFWAETEGLEAILRGYTIAGQVSPKLWQDAYLAAFARAGKLRLVTFDQGFRKFEGLLLTLLD